MNLSVRGVVKEVSVEVAEVSAIRWTISSVTRVTPEGAPADTVKMIGERESAWKVVVALVVVEKSGGIERVRVESVRVLVA